MTVTPVLADQLEDAGRARAAARASWSSGGSAPPRPTCRRCRRSAGPPARPSWSATGTRWSCSTRPAATRCAPFQRGGGRGPGRARRLRRRPTRCCRCWRPRAGAAAAARRRHPLAPPPLRLGRRLLAARVRLRARARVAAGRARGALVLRRPERARASRSTRWRRSRPRPARWRCRSTGRRSRWLWSLDGYPSDPAHAQFAGKSLRGIRIWKVGGGAYDPAAAAEAARAARRASSSPRSRRACAPTPRERGRRGLLVFAIDTELLGHWWSEGPIWLRGGARRAPRRPGCGCSPSPQALAEHEPVERPLRRLDLGRGQGPARPGTRRRSPTSPGARGGSSCACCGRSPAGLRGEAARPRRARAARRPGERLGLPRPARPGGRLRLPARHRSRPGDAGGHRLRPPAPTRVCAPSPRT